MKQNAMDPKQWGPVTWRTMHAFAWEADRRNTAETKTAFLNFMNTLTDLLPCEICRQHLQQYLKDNPVPHTNFFAYTVHFHNDVNTRLGKKNYTLEEATKIWTSVSCGSCSSTSAPSSNFNTYIIFFAVFTSLVLFLYSQKDSISKWISATQQHTMKHK